MSTYWVGLGIVVGLSVGSACAWADAEVSGLPGAGLPGAGVPGGADRPSVPVAHQADAATPAVSWDQPIWDWPTLTNQWFGQGPALADQGISLDVTLTTDWSKNFQGGISTDGTTFRHLLDVGLTVDTHKLLGWEGGTFYALFQHHQGSNGSDDTGDWQWYSNIDADGRTQLSELWYEQRLWDDQLRIKFGKGDANCDFAVVNNGAEFLNSSAGLSPTVLGCPSYPDQAMGLNLFVTPVPWVYAGFGIYDGAGMQGIRTGSRGPASFFNPEFRLFYIGEIGLQWALADESLPGLPGRLVLGGWHHDARMDRFDGGTQRGTDGCYVIFEQQLWRPEGVKPDDARGLAIFLQYGWADPMVSPVHHHIGGGLAWTGPLPGREEDVTGLGVQTVLFSRELGAGFDDGHETAVECFYKVQLTSWISVKPDLQYIIHPGGLATNDDALVGTLRVEVKF